jgi:hypothetical protein
LSVKKSRRFVAIIMETFLTYDALALLGIHHGHGIIPSAQESPPDLNRK